MYVENENFQGQVLVRLRRTQEDRPYFLHRLRNFSFSFKGSFKKTLDASDVMFGAEFDHPIKPPFGSSIGLKFAHLIDPSLKADLHSAKPWLLSPLICAMNTLTCIIGASSEIFNPLKVDQINIEQIKEDYCGRKWSSSQRRSYFSNAKHLEDEKILSSAIYIGDFFGPAIDFAKMVLVLGPFHLNFLNYVNHQPIRFVCKSKHETFFAIEFTQEHL